MVRKIISLSDDEIIATLLSEDMLKYSYNGEKYFDKEYKRKPGKWDDFKIISTTIIDADLKNYPAIDYTVIVHYLPSGEYYFGSIRELPGEEYEPLCKELTQVFPTPVTEIKYT